jgi:enoyl-CoA hydratase/carnithine racemase
MSDGSIHDDRIRLSVADHIAEVALVRSDKHNALDGPMFESITAAAAAVSAEPGVRAVVIHGEGPSFCSGIDVGWLAGQAGERFAEVAADRDRRGANMFQRVATDWLAVPVPVIAAIHGSCLGGGLQIALGADIRITAPDAKMSIREIHWGLIPDMGITATLPRLVPLDVAKELTFTGQIVSGEEATRIGLATRVDPDPLDAARTLAAEIAGRSPDAVRATKRLYEAVWPSPRELGLEFESELQTELIGRPNQVAAITAGMTGEPPSFTDPDPAGGEGVA